MAGTSPGSSSGARPNCHVNTGISLRSPTFVKLTKAHETKAVESLAELVLVLLSDQDSTPWSNVASDVDIGLPQGDSSA